MIAPFGQMDKYPSEPGGTTVTFKEDGANTKMRLTWVPYEASKAEIACFAAAIDGMGKGWAAGMVVLADLLAELQA